MLRERNPLAQIALVGNIPLELHQVASHAQVANFPPVTQELALAAMLVSIQKPTNQCVVHVPGASTPWQLHHRAHLARVGSIHPVKPQQFVMHALLVSILKPMSQCVVHVLQASTPWQLHRRAHLARVGSIHPVKPHQFVMHALLVNILKPMQQCVQFVPVASIHYQVHPPAFPAHLEGITHMVQQIVLNVMLVSLL